MAKINQEMNTCRCTRRAYAAIVDYNGRNIRSSFFGDRESALEYAIRMAGIIAVEEIGNGGAIIWQRIPA